MFKKIIINLFLFLLVFLIGCYIFCIFGLPKLLNNQQFVQKIENLFYKKTNTNIVLKNSNINISPLFILNWQAQEVYIDKNNKGIIKLQNINCNADIKRLTLQKVFAEKIFVNVNSIKNLKKSNNSNKKNKFDFSKVPEISIKELILFSDKEIKYEVNIRNFELSDKSIKFNSTLVSSDFKKQLNLSANGKLFKSRNFLKAENLKIFSDDGFIIINGKLFDRGKIDFFVESKQIPVDKTMKLILYLQKLNDPTKKFIENFTDYAGNLSFHINVKNNGLFGKITVENLFAKTVMFNIPINFKKAEFFVEKDEINSVAYGDFGTEKVIHKLKIINLLSPHREVFGEVKAPFTNRLVSKYVPDARMKNNADADVSYYFKDKKIDVKYNLDLKEGTDIFYKNIYLGLENKHRRFFARTFKDGNNIFLKEYNYSLIEDGETKNIILGNGLFTRINGIYRPQFVIYRTNGFAPVSAAGSFNRYVYGGEFRGEMKYDFNKKSLVGNFEVKDTIFNKFYVEKAVINADEKELKAYAEGKYHGQSFSSNFVAENKFDDKIIVKKMDLFLDKYILMMKPHKKHKKNKREFKPNFDISKKVRNINMTVENMSITMNAFIVNKVILKNIKLIGNLKNNILNFSMTEMDYANGILRAKGLCDFNKEYLCADFSAKNIDANIVAATIFDLPDEVVGTANATLHVELFKKLRDIKAHATFEIDNGFLPKIGNTEFILLKSRKFKLADVVNVDLTKRTSFEANLKGSFNFNKSKIKNVRITSKQQYLAMFIEGDYDMDKQYTSLDLYGKYNKSTSKGVKVFHIPLNLILKTILKPENSSFVYTQKLNNIPQIDAEKDEEQYFRVKLKGNIKSNNIDVELKRIK